MGIKKMRPTWVKVNSRINPLDVQAYPSPWFKADEFNLYGIRLFDAVNAIIAAQRPYITNWIIQFMIIARHVYTGLVPGKG